MPECARSAAMTSGNVASWQPKEEDVEENRLRTELGSDRATSETDRLGQAKDETLFNSRNLPNSKCLRLTSCK